MSCMVMRCVVGPVSVGSVRMATDFAIASVRITIVVQRLVMRLAMSMTGATVRMSVAVMCVPKRD